jgi:hypothetical protein
MRGYYPDKPWVEMPIPSSRPPDFSRGIVDPELIRIATYKRHELRVFDRVFTVLVHSDLDMEEAVFRLVQYYNPPIPQ